MSQKTRKRAEARRAEDPLVDRTTRGERAVRLGLLVVASIAFHGLIVGISATFVSMVPESEEGEDEEPTEVEIVRNEPEPEPPEPPPPEPEPEPEPEPVQPEPEPPEPEPEPDPDPKPKPPPEPEEPPEPQPKPKAEPDQPPEEPSEEPESMDPVDLSGMTMESTAEGSDGPTMKVGQGINSEGRITDNYVDPDEMDDIKTGEGDGEGLGKGDGPAEPSPGRNCPSREASAEKRVRVDRSDYPIEAKRRGIQGEVVAVVTVGTNGEVTDVDLKKRVGGGLDELAVEAFRQWTFKPARQNCRPVESKVRVTHAFRLQR